MTPLTVEQFVEAKRKLEQDLALVVQRRVSEFEQAIGYSPSWIQIELAEVQAIGQPTRHIVSRVLVAVPLDGDNQ